MSCGLLLGEGGCCRWRQGWSHQPSMSVSDQTTTRAQGVPLCTPLVAEQEASAAGAGHAWYGHVVRRRWWWVWRRSGLAEDHTTVSCSSLDGKKRKLDLVFRQLQLSVNEQLDAAVEVGNIQIVRAQCRVQQVVAFDHRNVLQRRWPILCWWDVKPYSINQSIAPWMQHTTGIGQLRWLDVLETGDFGSSSCVTDGGCTHKW